ncbi:MAG: hypothetical protein HOQ17_05265 [Gemmatimonadaceae bacterium]|nr:hypothetical protein [Gemmatimonadaceae bacterium]NUP56348.1 hypothetical protein [Gemmatimonadaceae bacterium]NUS32450.1 hypothetical protein [Gemmatimonadaceae bacterium]
MSARLRQLAHAAFAMIMLAVASCSGDGVTSSRQRLDLASAKQRWARFAPASYQITVGRSCFCTPETTRPVIVTVRNGQVESRRYEGTGADVPSQFAPAYPSVDGLFGVIDHAVAEHAATVDVLYDGARGFPVSIQIDGSPMIADDELYYGTRDFVVR